MADLRPSAPEKIRLFEGWSPGEIGTSSAYFYIEKFMTAKEIIEKARINFKSGVPEILFRMVNAQCSVTCPQSPYQSKFQKSVVCKIN
jgi:hypothetical protein